MDVLNPRGMKKRLTPDYSRTGCVQCKKAHTKCDEVKPVCSKCSRKNKDCVYQINFITAPFVSSNKTSFVAGGVPFSKNKQTNTPTKIKSIKMYNRDNKDQKHTFTTTKLTNPKPTSKQPPQPKSQPPLLNNGTLTGGTDQLNYISMPHEQQSDQQNEEVNRDSATSPTFDFDSTTFDNILISKPPFPLLDKYKNAQNYRDTLDDTASPNNLELFSIDEATELQSDIFFPQSNFRILNLLNFDTGTEPVSFFDCYTNEEDESLPPRDYDSDQMFSYLSRIDPIYKYYTMHLQSKSNNLVEDLSSIPVENEKFMTFIWSIYYKTYGLNNFALFPEDMLNEIMIMLKSLNESYPIVHTVIRYAVASYMKNLYHRKGLTDLSNIWDAFVLIPSMKPCIEIFNARINKSYDYSECSTLAFSAAVLFSSNSTSLNSDWKSHMSGVFILLKKALRCFEYDLLNTKKGRYAFALYGMTNSIFCRAEVVSYIAAENGGVLSNEDELNAFYNVDPFSTYHLLNGQSDLTVGCVNTIYPACRQITSEMIRWKQRGVNLSGTSIIKFKFTNTNEKFAKELEVFGKTILDELTTISKNIYENDSIKKNAIKSVSDYKLIFSLENCNYLTINAVRIYLMIFFINEDKKGKNKIIVLLEESLKLWYGMPYGNSIGLKSNWALHYLALAAIVLGLDNIENHFCNIIEEMANKGLEVAARSYERLRYISRRFKAKDYNNLVDRKHSQFFAY